MIHISQAQPGDLVFCHSAGAVGAGIRLVERIRRDYEGSGADWNHVAVLDTCKGDPLYPAHWTVLQAEGRGVTRGARLSSVAPGGRYEIAPLPNDCDRDDMLEFMRAQVGSRYGFVTVASILLTLFTPSFFNVMLAGTWICSAVAAESLRAGGWLHNWPDLYCVTPAQLWMEVAG